MHNWCMYETFFTQINRDILTHHTNFSSLNYRFSLRFNLDDRGIIFSWQGMKDSVIFMLLCGESLGCCFCCSIFLSSYSILDVVANKRFLEVVPAVISVFGVTNLCIGHAAHGADVSLDALLFVLGDGHGR